MAVNDTFDRHTGNLVDYSTGPITTVLPDRKHYDIRIFSNDTYNVPWTLLQMELWNYEHFAGKTMVELESGNAAPGIGENWTNATTIGANSTFRQSNALTRTVTVGSPQTVSSTFDDDIYTDFTGTSFIELVLRDFPAQAAGARFDLANSFIDFTSDAPAYSAGNTDSIRFNQSLNSLTAGGNLTFRINRDLLVNSLKIASGSPQHLNGIRFRLTAAGAGTATFTASAMRLVPSGFTYEEIDPETKRGVLARAVPQAGGTEPSSSFGWIYFNQEQPIDNDFWVRFYNGSNPSGNDNKISLAFRYSDSDLDSYRVTFNSRAGASQIVIDYWDGASATNIYTLDSVELPPNLFYYLRVTIEEDTINVGLYNTVGVIVKKQIVETGFKTMPTHVRKGYIGYSFEPYTYDFWIDFLGSNYSEYGSFESTIFESNSFVKAANLFTFGSKNIDLFEDLNYTLVGDIVTSEWTEDDTLSVTRSGNEWWGGIHTPVEFIGDTRYASITGEILTTSTPRGVFRILLRDNYGQVVWRSGINPAVKNQWLTFKIPVVKSLPPTTYTIEIHQTGFYPDTFKVRNLSMNRRSIAWFASNNGGTNYYPFLNSIDTEFSALNFPQPGRELTVMATVTESNAWIQGYKLKPIYGWPTSIIVPEGITGTPSEPPPGSGAQLPLLLSQL